MDDDSMIDLLLNNKTYKLLFKKNCFGETPLMVAKNSLNVKIAERMKQKIIDREDEMEQILHNNDRKPTIQTRIDHEKRYKPLSWF